MSEERCLSVRLSEIQECFTYSLLARDRAGDTHLNTNASALANILKERHGVSAENRMKVYRNNVVQNLSNAVISALPMTRTLVGEGFLKKAVRAYIRENLPEEGNLNGYGRTFPAFIRTYAPAANMPYLYDVTRLEWAWEQAYYAEDDIALDLGELTRMDESDLPRLRLFFRASISLLQSVYPLDQIVDACRNKGDVEALEWEDRGAYMLIYRPALHVEMRRISAAEFSFLNALHRGEMIQTAVERACECDPSFDVTSVLQTYLAMGICAGYEIGEETA